MSNPDKQKILVCPHYQSESDYRGRRRQLGEQVPRTGSDRCLYSSKSNPTICVGEEKCDIYHQILLDTIKTHYGKLSPENQEKFKEALTNLGIAIPE